jgi:hypothetical protein
MRWLAATISLKVSAILRLDAEMIAGHPHRENRPRASPAARAADPASGRFAVGLAGLVLARRERTG